VNHIKLPPVLRNIFQRIGLVELEGIVRLRQVIHADNRESCTVIAHRCPACPTEQVK
jgi:hypothetical protein